MDNNHGKYPVYIAPETGKECWWITASCPLHGEPAIPVALTPDQFDGIEKGERP